MVVDFGFSTCSNMLTKGIPKNNINIFIPNIYSSCLLFNLASLFLCKFEFSFITVPSFKLCI